MAVRYLEAVDVLPLIEGEHVSADALALVLDDVHADAGRVAPCLVDGVDPDAAKQVKSVLRAVVVRWANGGANSVQTTQQVIGPFQVAGQLDSRTPTPRGRFWPSEIAALQDICSRIVGRGSRAWSLDQIGDPGPGPTVEEAFTRDLDLDGWW